MTAGGLVNPCEGCIRQAPGTTPRTLSPAGSKSTSDKRASPQLFTQVLYIFTRLLKPGGHAGLQKRRHRRVRRTLPAHPGHHRGTLCHPPHCEPKHQCLGSSEAKFFVINIPAWDAWETCVLGGISPAQAFRSATGAPRISRPRATSLPRGSTGRRLGRRHATTRSPGCPRSGCTARPSRARPRRR